MPDRFGPRGVIALVIPVQNSNMQPEYEALRPPGVSNQVYRFFLEGKGDTPLTAALRVIPDTLKCWPDLIVVGNSVEMRGVSESEHFAYRGELAKRANGVPVVTAAEACEAALRTLKARRIGLLSPMSAEHSAFAAAYYRSRGFEVAHSAWLDIELPEHIIGVASDRIREAFASIARDGIDTLLHVGSALAVVDMLDELEATLARPIVSVNAATYWYALRRLGVADAMPGFGTLLQDGNPTAGVPT